MATGRTIRPGPAIDVPGLCKTYPDLDGAKRLCDRIAGVHAGTIVAMDMPAKLLARLGDEIIEICVTGDRRWRCPATATCSGQRGRVRRRLDIDRPVTRLSSRDVLSAARVSTISVEHANRPSTTCTCSSPATVSPPGLENP
jgi:ABC-type proline/glycine betaine transport system ATPase subunit